VSTVRLLQIDGKVPNIALMRCFANVPDIPGDLNPYEFKLLRKAIAARKRLVD
jgi:hypothetical protein